MVVGNVPEAADFIVAGAGPGGYVAALRASAAGRKVLLVDKNGPAGIGGTCLHTGCIPSKALIEASHLKFHAARGMLGVSASEVSFAADRFQAEKDALIARLTGGVSHLLNNANVECIAGELSLTDENAVVVNMSDDSVRFYTFESLVLATGSSIVELGALPFDGVNVLSSADILSLRVLPPSLGVVGAGYIGVELGIALAKLGVEVTLFDIADRVLPLMPKSLSVAVTNRLRSLGVQFFPRTEVTGFDGAVVSYCGDDGVAQVQVSKVLVAVGRRPNTDTLGLEVCGVNSLDDGLVPVDEARLVQPRVAAIGDIVTGPALAHKAMAEADVAVGALCGKRVGFDAEVPEIVFSDPEIATVGLSPEMARADGIETSVSRFPLSASGRAMTLGEHDGFTELVCDRADGTILGVQMAGSQASERIAEAVVAIELGASAEDLALCVHPHPTLSETIGEAAAHASGRPIHLSR